MLGRSEVRPGQTMSRILLYKRVIIFVAPVESKTRTHHGRVGSGRRTAGRRGGAGPGRTGSRQIGPSGRQQALAPPTASYAAVLNDPSEPVESKTRTHNGRVGSARRRADGGAGRRWAEQGADISVALEANRPSGPPAQCKQLF